MVNAFTSELFPTLDLPAKATSLPSSGGIALELRAAAINLHSPEKIFLAFSISASSYNKFLKLSYIRLFIHLIHYYPLLTYGK